MERQLLNPYDKEFMKMAMLKHEETFREQVYELHRLYRIQKVLMKDIMKQTRKGMDCAISSSYDQIEESDLELTLGPTKSYNGRRRKAGDKPLPADSRPNFPSQNGNVIDRKRSPFVIIGS